MEDCLGSHTPVIPAQSQFPGIVRYGSFTYSALRLSAFDRLTMLPHSRWKQLYGEIFAPVLHTTKERVMEAQRIWEEQQRREAEANGGKKRSKSLFRWSE